MSVGPGPKLNFRGDISGLRAVAVLPVVAYHFGIPPFRSGFVGVDIFFVISGYLITAILTLEMDAGRFSILRFYHRRAVRILPALLAMVIIMMVAGTLLLLPSELRELGRTAAAAIGCVSNIYFWLTGNYFDASAETKAMLHTWSLGVEEQFYIFYPILLLLLRRFWPHHLKAVLVAVVALSFALGLYLAVKRPLDGFYLLPARAWELGLGGLIAVGAFPALHSARLRNAVSVAGALAIIAGLLLIRGNSYFPAPWAILPCGGAALLIAYGEHAVTARALCLSWMRGIGTISYSLYLWHWPLITFYRLEYGMKVPFPAAVMLFVAALAFGYASYRFVEQPFSRRFKSATPRLVVGLAAASMAATVAAALGVTANAAALRPLDERVRRVEQFADYIDMPDFAYQFRASCFATSAKSDIDLAACLKFSPIKQNVVLLGDSHAAQYWRAVALRFPRANVMQATASGCRPILDARGQTRCIELVAHVLGSTINLPGLSGVVLAARWQADELPALGRTIRYLRSRHLDVTIIGPTVEYDRSFPQLLARALRRGDSGLLDRSRSPGTASLNLAMRQLAGSEGAHYVDAYEAECPASRCLAFAPDGAPLNVDTDHLSFSGARFIVARMRDI